MALGEHAVMEERYLRRSAAHVGIIAHAAVGVLHEVVAEQLRLSRTGDNLQSDARMLLYALHHLLAVVGIAHG